MNLGFYIAKEWRYHFANIHAWLIVLAFLLLMQSLYAFVSANIGSDTELLDVFFILVFILFAHLLLFSLSREDDYQNNIYEQFFLRGASMVELLFGKYIMYSIVSAILAMFYIAVHVLLMQSALSVLPLLSVVGLYIPILNIYLLFCSSLMLGSSHSQLLAFILLPFMFPILILVLKAYVAYEYQLILLGLLLIQVPLLLNFAARIVVNSIRHY